MDDLNYKNENIEKKYFRKFAKEPIFKGKEYFFRIKKNHIELKDK